MIKQKDLSNRVYEGRNCKSFEYVLNNDKADEMLVASFKLNDNKEWRMTIVLERTRDADSQVYNFTYVMPSGNVPLELIAATGLRYFQLYIKQEIQQKSNIDFALGNVLGGM